MPGPDNLGVEILVLSSVDLISNTCLLPVEALTGEPNEKQHISNSRINDKVETILICAFYVFNKTMVYRRGLIGKRHKYTQPTSDETSALYQIKSSGVSISTVYRWKSEPKKRKQLLERKDELRASVKKRENIQKSCLN